MITVCNGTYDVITYWLRDILLLVPQDKLITLDYEERKNNMYDHTFTCPTELHSDAATIDCVYTSLIKN